MSSLKKLRLNLKESGVDAAIISSVPNIIYLTGFSGFSNEEREGFLFITQDKQYVLTTSLHKDSVLEKIGNFEFCELSSSSPLGKVIHELTEEYNIKNLGIEENDLTVLELKLIMQGFKSIKPLQIKALRTQKVYNEIKSIENACTIADRAFESILIKIKKGITEKELAFELEFSIKRQGADIAFPPVVAFGINSATPHHKPTDHSLETGSQILLDFGARKDNFCSDLSRTVFFGKTNDEQKIIYNTVLQSQQKAVEKINQLISERKPVMASDIDKVSRAHIASHGYPTFPHSLGHGIGIEVHEYPNINSSSDAQIETDTVFSIEPGIYIPQAGGIRIEDLFVLETTGIRQLSHSPNNIIELQS